MTPKQNVCGWMIAPMGRMTPVRQCNAPATHWSPESGGQYCDDHAGDYVDVFGDLSLREFPIEEEKP